MGSSFGTSDRAYSKRLLYVSFQSTILYFSCSAIQTRICQGGVSDTCPSSIDEASRAAHASRSMSVPESWADMRHDARAAVEGKRDLDL